MRSAFRFVRTLQKNGLEVWQVDLGAMPLSHLERPALAALLLNMLHDLGGRYGLTETVWLEATHIHLEGATRLIAPNARLWVPKTGFGVHPDGEPPRMWTDEDFSGAAFGTPIPIFNNQVFEISRKEGHQSAIEAMAGRGVLSLALLSGNADRLKQEMHTILAPLVRERAFHAYSYFFPLLTARSSEDYNVRTWMGSASVYIREVFEDKSLLVISAVPFEPCLQAIQAEHATDGVWDVAGEKTFA